jgi:hypothetical protein
VPPFEAAQHEDAPVPRRAPVRGQHLLLRELAVPDLLRLTGLVA